MELLILICLLVVIFLLVEERIAHGKRPAKNNLKKDPLPDLPDIMGRPRPVQSHVLPNIAPQSQHEEDKAEADNFEIEIDEEDVAIEIPQEDLDEVFSSGPDLWEEEEEWNRYGMQAGDNGFATGVTFEELSTVGMLLSQEVLEPSQQNIAIGLVQKIQGTELLSLLENSIEGASRKIADLLDRSLSGEAGSSSSFMRKNDLEDFDIGEFV
nr:hypothetical protein [Chryseobacterium populi]